ncbi:MAG: ATPase, T2SS/T4P/T4SS family [Candidatus Sumerlaeaceae bacterium]
MTQKHKIVCVLFLTAVFFVSASGHADKLVFRTGSVIEGIILEETADHILFRDRSGEVRSYSKTLLQSVQREESALGTSVADVLQRARSYRQAGKFDAALEVLVQAAANAPGSANALSEEFQATLFQLDAALKEVYPRDKRRARELLVTRQKSLQSSGTLLLVPARATLESWRKETSKSLAAIDYELAVSFSQQPNKLPQIRELLLEAIALDPQNANAHLYLADTALALDDIALAMREYKTALGFSGTSTEFRQRAEQGLQVAQARLAARQTPAPVRTQLELQSPPGTQSLSPQPEAQPSTKFAVWLAIVEQRLEKTGIMAYVRPVWREISSGEYNAYLIGVPSFVFVFWLLPYWFVRYRSKNGDVLAAELREPAKKIGLVALLLYLGRALKSAKPKNRCPFCNKSLDKLDAYTDLNFYACPHCHEPITPIYDLKDYIDHLVKQIELQLKHSKESVIAGVERDLMLKLVRAVITLAVRRRASDLHLETEVDGAKLRVRIDGMMYDFMHLPRSVSLAFISALKIMANLDITERRIPQDGKIGMWIDKVDLDLRINTSPAAMGEKVTIRILNPKSIAVDPVRLGLEGENLERFERAIHRPHGMIIVTGPAGSGKSTTLYVALNLINTGEKNIVTLEDPIEYQIKGASQMQVNPATNFTFATGLRSILRQDPDVIMVGEIRDSETAEIAVEAALTGHLLLTTLHTIDSATAFARMADLGVDTSRMASALICIIAQRLVRTICPNCKKPYKPKRELLEQLNVVEVPRDFTFVHGAGCAECMNTGYCGRMGLFEFLMPDDQMREVLEGAPPVSVIRELSRKKGFASLKEEGVRRVLSGLTTVEEVLRVTS